jgi:ATP-binding cassette subfamily F protein 3
MMPSNFLLLDEPTNHLDMRAKDVLLTSLQEFTGTVVFVSHDRYFIDKLATRVFEVADGGVHIFPGNYEEYQRRKSDQAAIVPVPASGNGTQPPPRAASQQQHKPSQQQQKPQAAPQPTPAQAAAADKQRRLNPIKLRQMKERQRGIEDEITRLEVEIADFEQALSHFQSAQQSIDIAEMLESRRTDMKNLMAEWEEVSEILEANR